MNDLIIAAVEELKNGGLPTAGIVLELVEYDFSYLKIGEIFSMMGHLVALGPGSTEFRGEMLISDVAGLVEVGSTATSVAWGHRGEREDDLPFRNHAEEILVETLFKQGASIRVVVEKLIEVGLTGSELRDLFTRLGHQIYGGGYGDPQGWMIVVSRSGDLTKEEDFAPIHWGDDDSGSKEAPIVTWN